MKNNIYLISLLVLLISLAGCNMPGSKRDSSGTPDVTQAYQTVQAHLTRVSTLTPAQTSVISPIVSLPPVISPSAPAIPTPTLQSIASPSKTTVACDRAAAGSPKIDVTIDDNTLMQPGQSFQKIWRLQNTGTCSWTNEYSIALFSGEVMSAPNFVSLPNKVDPGQSVDVAVNLVAPQQAGTYQGDWKLRNASGNWFGIGPGNTSFWVRIVVSTSLTPSAIITNVTSTSTGTIPVITTTPEVTPGTVLVTGSNQMLPDDVIDLDKNVVNTGDPDLGYFPNQRGRMTLLAQGGTVLAQYDFAAPSLADCQAASLGEGQIALRNLPLGLYVCYRTGQGNYGWLRVINWTETEAPVEIEILTWYTPST